MNLRKYYYCPVIVMLFSTPLQAERITVANNTVSDEMKYHCSAYVDKSLQQNQLNKQYDCGFTGLRWNDERAGQYQWCLTVRQQISYAEQDARQTLLEQCFSRKTARDNPGNHPALPPACRDSNGQYQAVKSIYTEFRYDKAPASPVTEGLIRYDYNQDQQDDYLFLELKENMAHISVCLSQPGGYQRRLSNVIFYAPGGGLEGDQYTISQQDDLLKIDLLFFGHNMGSAYRNTTYRYNTATQNFEMVDSEGGSSPIEMDGQPYPMSSPPAPDMTLK